MISIRPGDMVVPVAYMPRIVYSHINHKVGGSLFAGVVVGRLNIMALVIATWRKLGEDVVYVLYGSGELGWVMAEAIERAP